MKLYGMKEKMSTINRKYLKHELFLSTHIAREALHLAFRVNVWLLNDTLAQKAIWRHLYIE